MNTVKSTVKKLKKLLVTSTISTGVIILNSSSTWAVAIGLFNTTPFIFPGDAVNLIKALNEENTITEFSELDADTWQEIANENQVIVIPSNEGDSLFQALSLETRNVIQDYVSSGGGFLTTGLAPTAIELMNGLFGYNIEENFVGGSVPLNTANAEGTVFESGPSSLPPLFFIDPLRLSSLPDGSISFYDFSSQDSTSIFVSPFGNGLVGFNAFNYATPIEEAGGWPIATNNTVEFLAQETVSQTVPEPSLTLGLLILGGFAASRKAFKD